LLEQEKHLFALWYQVRDGTLSRRDLSGAVAPIRSRVHELLIAAATNERHTGENALGKTVRTCRQLLQVEPALWLFVTTVGVEPTNNAAERFIRCLSYGDAPVSGLRVKREVFCGTDAECDDDFAFPESGCLGVFSPSLSARQGKPALLYCLFA